MARINAASFHENPSIEEVCRLVRSVGFDSLEVSRPFFNKLLAKGTRKAFADWVRSLDLTLYGFDCWVEVEPYRAYDETLQGFQGAIDFAAELNLAAVITRDPWTSINKDRSPIECLKLNIALFQAVADLAAAKQLTVIFEPHPDTLSMDNDWAIDFIEGINRPNVGLVYDCCHYGVGQPRTYVQAIEKLGRRIQHLHFSDGDRRTYGLHLPLGEGELDLHGIVDALKAIGFRGALTNDMYGYPLLEEGVRRNAPKIRQLERELGIPT